MGKSPTIDDLQKQDERHYDYIKKLEENVTQRGKAFEDNLSEIRKAFYTENKYDDSKLFVAGKSIDYQHQKEWSLENLQRIIESIKDSLFGKKNPPKGAEIDKSPALDQAMKSMENLELYLVSKCFEIITGVLSSFSTKTSQTYKYQTKIEALAPGLTLFVTVVANTYQSADFFNNELIYEYYYIYSAGYSKKQATDQVAMSAIEAYANVIAALSKKLEETNDKFLEENSTMTLEMYETFTNKIDGLIKKNMKALHDLEKGALASTRLTTLNKKLQLINLTSASEDHEVQKINTLIAKYSKSL